ncbi:hypothetical protein [Trichothermofontia sp.]
MKWISYLAGFSSVALLIVGCGGTQPPAVSDRPLDTPTAPAMPSTSSTPEGSLPSVAHIPMSGDPYVPATDARPKPSQAAHHKSAGLIKPVNATERLPKVRVGRQNPFAPVTTQAVVVATQQPPPVVVPNLPPPASVPAVEPPALSLPTLPTLPASTTATLPDRAVPAPPARLADEVAILGVVSVSGRVSAIVQVPNESTSRYVHEGEFLSGGRLWVKRIDPGEMGDPIVVLEEGGVEVFRGIGPGLNQPTIGSTPNTPDAMPTISVS